MRPIVISLSPNTEPDDIRLAWRTLLQSWRWKNDNFCVNIEHEISELMAGQSCVLTSSGRAALYYALQSLGIGVEDEVIVQAFTCLAVPAAVVWTGATPVFADIEETTYNLDPSSVEDKISPKTKAIILQHTFGLPANVIALREIAKKKGILLIEDCAHSFGGWQESNPLGTLGDLAILSFGRDKTISSIFGGAVVSKNAKLIGKIRARQKALPLPPVWWNVQQLLHPILLSILVPLYFKGGIGKILLVIVQKLKILSLAVSAQEKTGDRPNFLGWQFSPALAPLLLKQVKKLRRYTEHRRRVAYLYAEALKLSDEIIKNLDNAAWLRVPYRVKDASDVLMKARRHRILLGDWYSTPVTPCSPSKSDISHYKIGSCPVAEKLSKETINLPTYPLMTRSDVDRVISFVKS